MDYFLFLMTETGIWLGIVLCVFQSALFSGSNIAFFSISRLQLEIEVKHGSESAEKVLLLREDANFLLTTILWGNVATNVLLTLLSGSVLLGVYSFLFSTVVITFLGEIIPQAYFSRNALKMASLLSPFIKFYQLVLYFVAKPTALVLDAWLGKEGITYFREEQLKAVIAAHLEANEAEVMHVEGTGALNFLEVDKISVLDEGEALDPKSIIQRPYHLDLPTLPQIETTEGKDFIKKVHLSGHKWIVLVNDRSEPLLVLDADGYLRSVAFDEPEAEYYKYCHRPVVIRDESCTVGDALNELKKADHFDYLSTEVLHNDIVLVWTDSQQRIITGADILGRLLKGIGQKTTPKE